MKEEMRPIDFLFFVDNENLTPKSWKIQKLEESQTYINLIKQNAYVAKQLSKYAIQFGNNSIKKLELQHWRTENMSRQNLRHNFIIVKNPVWALRNLKYDSKIKISTTNSSYFNKLGPLAKYNQ